MKAPTCLRQLHAIINPSASFHKVTCPLLAMCETERARQSVPNGRVNNERHDFSARRLAFSKQLRISLPLDVVCEELASTEAMSLC